MVTSYSVGAVSEVASEPTQLDLRVQLRQAAAINNAVVARALAQTATSRLIALLTGQAEQAKPAGFPFVSHHGYAPELHTPTAFDDMQVYVVRSDESGQVLRLILGEFASAPEQGRALPPAVPLVTVYCGEMGLQLALHAANGHEGDLFDAEKDGESAVTQIAISDLASAAEVAARRHS